MWTKRFANASLMPMKMGVKPRNNVQLAFAPCHQNPVKNKSGIEQGIEFLTSHPDQVLFFQEESVEA